jgi:hypothetical protein
MVLAASLHQRQVAVKKYILAVAPVAAIAILIQSGCGGGRGSATLPIVTAPGSVAVFGGDAAVCSVISFSVTMTGLTLTPQSGGSPTSVLPGGNAVTVDFASLMDFATIFTLSNIPPGTYNALGITLANPQLTYLDTSTLPPSLKTISPTMLPLAINLNLSPAIPVASYGTVGLQLDFNLLNSVSVGSNNQFAVTPTFTAKLASASGSSGFAELEDLSGIVQSVSTNLTNSSFVGSFTISRPSTQPLTVYVTSSTTFDGVSGLSGLAAGTFVEIDAFLDANGNVVANIVEAEDQESSANGQAAFAGLITSVTPQTGNATQFTLLVREENPDMSSRVGLFSLLTVNIDPSSTRFGITAQANDFASFSFDATTLTAGQKVVVHGTLPSGSNLAQTATGRSIFLGLQSVLGNLSTNLSQPIAVDSDGLTGGFTLLPCSPLFQPAQITVLSSRQTIFTGGISNLNSLETPASHFLLVKGLLFNEQSIPSFGIMKWTVPANVEVAKQIHQLPSP